MDVSSGLLKKIIPITAHNEEIYDLWRGGCRHISSTYFGGKYRFAHVERGFFELIRGGKLTAALVIYTVF